jgi:hypothetical protein
MLDSLFLLRDRAQHVTGTRDVRQVNLGLEFFFAVRGSRRLGRSGSCFAMCTQVFPYELRFVLFQ